MCKVSTSGESFPMVRELVSQDACNSQSIVNSIATPALSNFFKFENIA